jgi:hypothetical protein
MTDKTRRVAPAQYEPQTEPARLLPRRRRGQAFFECPAPIVDLLLHLGELSW